MFLQISAWKLASVLGRSSLDSAGVETPFAWLCLFQVESVLKTNQLPCQQRPANATDPLLFVLTRRAHLMDQHSLQRITLRHLCVLIHFMKIKRWFFSSSPDLGVYNSETWLTIALREFVFYLFAMISHSPWTKTGTHPQQYWLCRCLPKGCFIAHLAQ